LTPDLHVSSLFNMTQVDDPSRVGATIKALREAYGFNLTKFAKAIGISHAHLANIEAGRRRVPAPLARTIADTLAIPLAAVITNRPVDEIA
jgi:transcriptional regulator with XRE-family HTH domain